MGKILCQCIKEVIDTHSIEILHSKEKFFLYLKEQFLPHSSDFVSRLFPKLREEDTYMFESFERNISQDILDAYYQMKSMSPSKRLKKLDEIIRTYEHKQYLVRSFAEGIAFAMYRGLFFDEIIRHQYHGPKVMFNYEYNPQKKEFIIQNIDYGYISFYSLNAFKLFIPLENLNMLLIEFKDSSNANSVSLHHTNVKKVYIGQNVSSVRGGKAAEYQVVTKNRYLTSHDGVIFNKDMTILQLFPSNRTGTYTLPANVKRIEESAFENSHLDQVICNKELEEIALSSFEWSHIKTMTINDNCHYIASSAFQHCNELSHIEFGTSLREIEWAVFANCSHLQDIIIPESINRIHENAFAATTIEKLTLRCHKNMTIEENAFYRSTIKQLNLIGEVEGTIEDETLLELIERLRTSERGEVPAES